VSNAKDAQMKWQRPTINAVPNQKFDHWLEYDNNMLTDVLNGKALVSDLASIMMFSSKLPLPARLKLLPIG
jgi:hypothetical protein